MSRAETQRALQRLVAEALGHEYRVVHVNHGDSHRRMLAYLRRCDRAYARSRRNQPPRPMSRAILDSAEAVADEQARDAEARRRRDAGLE